MAQEGSGGLVSSRIGKTGCRRQSLETEGV
jgi:hypothetical protein